MKRMLFALFCIASLVPAHAMSGKARCQSGYDFIYSVVVLKTDLDKTIQNSITEAREYGYFNNSDEEIRTYLLDALEAIKKDSLALKMLRNESYKAEKSYVNSCLGNPPQ